MQTDADRQDSRETGIGTRTPILDLLRFAAGGASHDFGLPAAAWETLDDRRFRHVSEAGLAPMLHHALAQRIDRLPRVRQEALLSADLTARVRYGSAAKVASEIIALCADMRVDVTLLKGISIAEQFYPAAHLRPMGDIDLLVPAQDGERVQSALVRRGYITYRDDWPVHISQHAAPLHHPEAPVWVEIHTALFPRGASLLANELFTPRQIASQSVSSTFHGMPVQRLSRELQLVYIASYWVRDLSMNSMHPSLLLALVDAVMLLHASGDDLDWDEILRWLDNEMAAASLYIVLTYLARHDLYSCPPTALTPLAASQKRVGRPELSAIHALLDACLVRGLPSLLGWRAPIAWSTLLARGSSVAKMASLPWKLAVAPSLSSRYGKTDGGAAGSGGSNKIR